MSTVDPAPAPAVVPPVSARPFGAGAGWIGTGWALFAKAPLMWVIFCVINFVLSIGLSAAGTAGMVVSTLLSPVLLGGMVAGCRSLEQGGELEVEHLLAGFQGPRLVPLLLVGAMTLAAYVVLLLLFGVFAGFSILRSGLDMNIESLSALATFEAVIPILIGLLVVAALAVPVAMAIWFAPELVVLNRLTPVAAIRESFVGCLKNVLPFLLWGIVMTVLAIVAVIPLALGLLILWPLLITSSYAAYREIYGEPPAA